MRQTIRFFLLILSLAIVFNGCKPRTRHSESNEDIRWAMIIKTMDDSTKNVFLDGFPFYEREKIKTLLKLYEHKTGYVQHREVFLNLTIEVHTSLENGKLRSQRAEYGNGTTAFEYYRIDDRGIADSACRYYPNGQLYSRTVNTVDNANSVHEEFHENGIMRSKNTTTLLSTWFKNGNRSGVFIFDSGQVVKRTLWHENGKKKEESVWDNDILNGTFQEWDSLGHQMRNEYYVKGKVKKGMSID